MDSPSHLRIACCLIHDSRQSIFAADPPHSVASGIDPGVVGRTGQKGLGVTGTGAPVGDPYDIDDVAHEVGHQFGGNHTFNGTTAGGNRNASTAYEPGSGSTIMAYAGIMAPEDLQNPAASPRDNGASPLFRSFDPTTSPVRTFPSLSYILNNANVPPATIGGNLASGEFLPTTNRTMSFRVTVRDNRAGGGGSNYASTTVTSTTSSGPFALTSFNTASTIAGGSAQTISWAVANSNLAPVNCANVKISLSTDGGQTYPFVLAASTPNDGSESVNVSNVATTQARFKIEAVGNIFFDLSNANTTITLNNSLTGFVEQFETGLPTLTTIPLPNHGAPGTTLSLATGDWFALNLSSPIGTTGVVGIDGTLFSPRCEWSRKLRRHGF